MKKLVLLPIVAAFAFAVLGVGTAAAQTPVQDYIASVTCDQVIPPVIDGEFAEGEGSLCATIDQADVANAEQICIDGTTYLWVYVEDSGGVDYTSQDFIDYVTGEYEVTGHVGACSTPFVAPPPPPRAGYCTVDGNTTDSGTPIKPGTFVNLTLGQPSTDSNYDGANPAFYVDGTGLTCDPPSGAFSLAVGELVDALGNPNPDGIMLPGNIYPHYVQG